MEDTFGYNSSFHAVYNKSMFVGIMGIQSLSGRHITECDTMDSTPLVNSLSVVIAHCFKYYLYLPHVFSLWKNHICVLTFFCFMVTAYEMAA